MEETPFPDFLESLPVQALEAWVGELKTEAPPAAAPAPGQQRGRNEPCRCGSGRKYKRCCLPHDQEREAAAQRGTQLPEELVKTLRRACRRGQEGDRTAFRNLTEGCLRELRQAGNPYWEAWCSSLAGDMALELGWLNEAEEYFTKGYRLAEVNAYTGLAGHALCARGRISQQKGEWSGAAGWYRQSREIGQLRDLPSLAGKLLLLEAACLFRAEEWDRSLAVCREGEQHPEVREAYAAPLLTCQARACQALGDLEGVRGSMERLSAYHRQRGQAREACTTLLQLAGIETEEGEGAFALARLQGLRYEIVSAATENHSLLPQIYFSSGRAAEGSGYLLQAIEQYQLALEALPDDSAPLAPADLLERLAEVHLRRNDLRACLDALNAGQEAARQAGDLARAVMLCRRAAELLYDDRRRDHARHCLDGCLPWLEALNTPAIEWPVRLTLAQWYSEAKQYRQALWHAEAAAWLISRDKDASAFDRSLSTLVLGESQESVHNWQGAQATYLLAVTEARKIRSPQAKFLALFGLARVSLQLGDRDNARRYVEVALDLHRQAALPEDGRVIGLRRLLPQTGELPAPASLSSAPPAAEIDLSGITIAVLGGENSDRLLLQKALRDRHNLGGWIEVPPRWYSVYSQKDLDVKLQQADLAVLLVGCTKHDLAYGLRSFHRRHKDLPVLYVRGGVTGAIRTIRQHMETTRYTQSR